MTNEPSDDDDVRAAAPWERSHRWNPDRPDSTRVEDLLARLGPGAVTRRSRHSDDDTEAVPASELIAAATQSIEPDAEPTSPAADRQTETLETAAPAPPGGTIPATASASAGDATGLLSALPSPPLRVPVGPVPSRSVPPPVTVDDHTEVMPRISAPVSVSSATILASLREAEHARTPAPSVSSNPPLACDHRARRALLVSGRAFIVLLSVLTLVLSGWYWDLKRRAVDGLAAHEVVGVLDTTDPDIKAPTVTPKPALPGVKTYQAENVLLLGSDTRAGSNGNAGNEDASTGDSANADTMMIAHIAADRQHVTILSMPRDTIIPAPQCKAWDFKTGQVSDQDYPVTVGAPSHLSSAYSVGGPKCVVTALQQVTGIRIDRYLGIDFVGFKAMVDALGGITITTCGPIVDTVLKTITDHGGTQTFTGDRALNLVRARDVKGDTESDLARIQRQQAVLSALLRQALASGTLTNPAMLDRFLTAFTQNTFNQNVSLDDLLNIASSLGNLDPQTVTFYTLPTTPSTQIDGALDIDQTKAPAVFDAIINDLPLPGQVVGKPSTAAKTTSASPKPTTTSPPSLALTVDPAKVPLKVYNVTGENGVAGKAQTALNAVGFKVTANDLFKQDNDNRTAVTVEFGKADRAAALTVAAAVPGSSLVEIPGLSGQVRLMLGTDYDGKIVPVRVGATAPASLATVSTATSDDAAGNRGDDRGTSSSTSSSPRPSTLNPTDLRPVNAANTSCIGPRPGSS